MVEKKVIFLLHNYIALANILSVTFCLKVA